MVESPTLVAAGRRHRRPRHRARSSSGSATSVVGEHVPAERGAAEARAQRCLRPRAAARAGPERDHGDGDRHRRPLALGAVPRRAAPALPRDAVRSCPRPLAGAVGLVGLGWGAQRLRRRRAMRRRFNPYIAGAPVLDDDMFYGREKLTARMLSTLHRNSLMITGERRIGKTTFLHHLKRVLAEDEGGEWRFFPVFVDLQGVPEQAFFHALMAEVVDGLEPRARDPRGAALRARARGLRRPRLQPRPAAGDRGAQDAHAAQGEARAADRRGGRAQRVLRERQPAPARHLHEELLREPGGGDERGRDQAALEERGQPLVQLLRRDRARRPSRARRPRRWCGSRWPASSAGGPRRSSAMLELLAAASPTSCRSSASTRSTACSSRAAARSRLEDVEAARDVRSRPRTSPERREPTPTAVGARLWQTRRPWARAPLPRAIPSSPAAGCAARTSSAAPAWSARSSRASATRSGCSAGAGSARRAC